MAALEPGLVADCLVNVFGALGTLVVAHSIARSDPWGAVAVRARWALHVVALLFLLRCAAWSSDSRVLDWLTAAAAAATPVAALLVAEGLLRRHAPKWMKCAVVGASLGAVLLGPLPVMPAWLKEVLLLLAVMGGFLAVALLLLTRDRATLTPAENAAVRRVTFALLVLTPMIATDFRALFPDIPVRMGAVGALLLLFFGFGPGSAGASNAERLGSLAAFGFTAALFAFGYMASGQTGDGAQFIRAGAVGLSGLIFAALFAELIGARAERRKSADPLLTAQSPAQFIDRLQHHPVIGNARLLDTSDLEQLRHPHFDALLALKPLLPWGLASTDEGVERVLSLMISSDATHVMRLSRRPLQLLIFALPAAATDPRTESELSAAQRIGELLFERGATA